MNYIKWLMQGIEEGMSQMAVQSHDGSRNFVWNFPIESWWRSCNPHGWPRLILCVYEAGAGNNDIIHGYGSTLLPFCPGLTILFIPQLTSITLINRFNSVKSNV